MAGMYKRFAKDLNEELFDSVYRDLYDIAMRDQNRIALEALRTKTKPYVGEAQETLNGFCHGTISLGTALDYIKIQKAYA